MSTSRRFLLALALLPTLLVLPAAPATAAEEATGDDNTAVAVNTEDGASIFRLAFSIRRVANGVIDETNSAYALANCSDCQTVALAFQVVLALGDVDVAIPENRAVAYNDECIECVTYASATQIVLGFDQPARFTAEGRQRLAVLYQTLRSLEERAAAMTVTELNVAVQAAKAELVAILQEELLEVPAQTGNLGDDPPDGGDVNPSGSDVGSTPTTVPVGAGDTTTTTVTQSSTTTTSSSTTTSTVNEPGSTTTTQPTTTTAATAPAGGS